MGGHGAAQRALPAEIESALWAEFAQAGWSRVEFTTLEASDYRVATRRLRRFMMAMRTEICTFYDPDPIVQLRLAG